MSIKKSALALLLALSVVGCASQQASEAPAPALAENPVAEQNQNVQQRALAKGLYEMVLSPAGDQLYIASGNRVKTVQGGVLYRLDPVTLQTTGETHTNMKDIGLAIDPQGKTIYITNSRDAGISSVDTESGKAAGYLKVTERNENGKPYAPHQLIWHKGSLYVSGVGDSGVIWVLDAQKMKLKKTIKNAGKWVTGLLYSEQMDRIYAVNHSGEILVINPRSNRIEARWKPLGEQGGAFLNIAEDPATGRLFVTDYRQAKTTIVVDIHTGKLLKNLAVGDSLSVKFNPIRNEIYISQRDAGKVLSLDGTTYALKQSWDLPPHPNSLLLSMDGQTLYVSVKQPRETTEPDSIVRIQLDQ